jgi:hypothetical protein
MVQAMIMSRPSTLLIDIIRRLNPSTAAQSVNVAPVLQDRGRPGLASDFA